MNYEDLISQTSALSDKDLSPSCVFPSTVTLSTSDSKGEFTLSISICFRAFSFSKISCNASIIDRRRSCISCNSTEPYNNRYVIRR